MKNINSKIENVKNEIEHNFKKSDSVKSVENIEKYLDLKREYYFSRTYVVYINHFINQYNFLNNYTKDLA
jgi:predicted porin